MFKKNDKVVLLKDIEEYNLIVGKEYKVYSNGFKQISLCVEDDSRYLNTPYFDENCFESIRVAKLKKILCKNL